MSRGGNGRREGERKCVTELLRTKRPITLTLITAYIEERKVNENRSRNICIKEWLRDAGSLKMKMVCVTSKKTGASVHKLAARMDSRRRLGPVSAHFAS